MNPYLYARYLPVEPQQAESETQKLCDFITAIAGIDETQSWRSRLFEPKEFYTAYYESCMSSNPFNLKVVQHTTLRVKFRYLIEKGLLVRFNAGVFELNTLGTWLQVDPTTGNPAAEIRKEDYSTLLIPSKPTAYTPPDNEGESAWEDPLENLLSKLYPGTTEGDEGAGNP